MKTPIIFLGTFFACVVFRAFCQSGDSVPSTNTFFCTTNVLLETASGRAQTGNGIVPSSHIHLTPAQKIKIVQLSGLDPAQWTVSDDGRSLTTIQTPSPQVEFSNVPPAPTDSQVATGPRDPMAALYLDQFMGTTNLNLLVKVSDLVAVKQDYLKFNFGGSKFDYSGHYAIWIPKARKHSTPLFGLEERAKAVSIHTSGLTTILPNATVWEKSPGFIDICCGDIECICSGSFEILTER
jgi:hypothetical protein